MAIVTISRQIGSGGDEIAARLANELSFTLVDQGLLVRLMQEHGLSRTEFDELDEEQHGREGRDRGETQVHVDLLHTLIANLAAEKDLVVLGRGGSVHLPRLPGRIACTSGGRGQSAGQAPDGRTRRGRELRGQSHAGE